MSAFKCHLSRRSKVRLRRQITAIYAEPPRGRYTLYRTIRIFCQCVKEQHFPLPPSDEGGVTEGDGGRDFHNFLSRSRFARQPPSSEGAKDRYKHFYTPAHKSGGYVFYSVFCFSNRIRAIISMGSSFTLVMPWPSPGRVWVTSPALTVTMVPLSLYSASPLRI